MDNNKALILMSGGLDSLVALDYVQKHLKIFIDLALTFDYGQKSAFNEIMASSEICKFYGVKHEVIKLDWLKNITTTSLVTNEAVPNNNFNTVESATSVWIPNRNALFLNIAGSYCDAKKYKYIVYGANKDEAQTFSDNTEVFREQITKLFQTSTLVHPKVLAPLINYGKNDIVKIAMEDSVPLELVWSCYISGEKHCGKCESCNYLKNALIANRCEKYINMLF